MREMKDSGVEWIGEIPKEWKVTRIKNLFELRNERNYEALEDVNLISLYTDKGVVQHSDLTETTGNKAVTADGYKIVQKDDIVVNIILCWMGAIGRSEYNGVTSPAYDVYKPNQDTNSKYFHYVFRTPQFNGECYRYGRGIMMMRWRTYSTEFRAINVPLPLEEEQHKIVAFLDKKLAQVESLITNVQTQIEKLKAYKQSLITEAVTKGLDPNVPMKDSGVEWIGEIPEHWQLSKVGMFYDVVLGKMLQPEKNNATDTYENYLCAANLGNNKLKLDSFKKMWFSEKDRKQYEVRKGDLIVVEGGDVASCDIVRDDVSCLYIQNALHRVRSKKECLLEFLRYSLIMSKGQGYISLICNKATIAHFTKDKFVSLPLLVVPIDEQQAIVNFLDNKCAQIDKLISLKQSKIEKLEQYKKSLIYEYVTGKKEVL